MVTEDVSWVDSCPCPVSSLLASWSAQVSSGRLFHSNVSALEWADCLKLTALTVSQNQALSLHLWMSSTLSQWWKKDYCTFVFASFWYLRLQKFSLVLHFVLLPLLIIGMGNILKMNLVKLKCNSCGVSGLCNIHFQKNTHKKGAYFLLTLCPKCPTKTKVSYNTILSTERNIFTVKKKDVFIGFFLFFMLLICTLSEFWEVTQGEMGALLLIDVLQYCLLWEERISQIRSLVSRGKRMLLCRDQRRLRLMRGLCIC